MRRSYSGLDDIIDLKRAFTVFGQVVYLLKLLQPVVQQPCTDTFVPLVISGDDFVHHLIDVKHHFSANEHNRAAV